jgi:hypothetical protein
MNLDRLMRRARTPESNGGSAARVKGQLAEAIDAARSLVTNCFHLS